ncbi:hypothetical protein ACQKQD_31780 [Methylobacterium sp. NPDC080182]|uniref:hypothetical protein n=1 Tax=Methylobacterium sp. NPDC080182 TaxID=3390590 RepID=UPI003D016DD4
MPQGSGVKNLSLAVTTTVMVSVLTASLPVAPAYSACLVCKGGALSIDKPFDKGGSLSIDKPFDKSGALSIDKPFDKGGALSIDKPFDTPFFKAVGKAATDVWDAVKRPFVETAKFLKDPLAGAKRKANELLDQGKIILRDLSEIAVKWLIIGFSALIGSVVLMAAMLAALIVRRTRPIAAKTESA